MLEHFHVPAKCGVCGKFLCAVCGAEAEDYDLQDSGLLPFKKVTHDCLLKEVPSASR